VSELQTFIGEGGVDEATGEAGKDSYQMLVLFDQGYFIFIARLSTGSVEVWSYVSI
jgi:hypothetical protein